MNYLNWVLRELATKDEKHLIPGGSGLSKSFRAVLTLLHQNPALASSLEEEPKSTQLPPSPAPPPNHVGLLTVSERLGVGSVVPSVWNDIGITRSHCL